MPIKRRYKIIGGIIMLAAVVIAALFQYSTQSNLNLAEALQFRRMLVTSQDDGIYRFFSPLIVLSMTRSLPFMRHHPFYDVLESRVLEWLQNAAQTTVTE